MLKLFYITFILQMQAGMPHFHQLIRIWFAFWKWWHRTKCMHFDVKVLLQCPPYSTFLCSMSS